MLEVVTPLSLKFEESELPVFDVHFEVEKTVNKLKDMLEEESTLTPGQNLNYSLVEDRLTVELPELHTLRKKKENQKFKNMCMDRMTHTGDNTNNMVQNLKVKLVPEMVRCLESRFESFNDEVIQNMTFVNPANWKKDDIESDLDAICALASHFEATLTFSGFQNDRKTLKKEWRDLRLTVGRYYKNFPLLEMWEKLLTYRRNEFPNIVKLVEIILCIGPSNAFVECGFSILTSMLSDRRLRLKHETMDDLLVIKANDSTWTPQEKEEIIECALAKHMSTRRKLKLDEGLASENTKKATITQRASIAETDSVSSTSCSDDSDSSPYESEPEYESFIVNDNSDPPENNHNDDLSDIQQNQNTGDNKTDAESSGDDDAENSGDDNDDVENSGDDDNDDAENSGDEDDVETSGDDGDTESSGDESDGEHEQDMSVSGAEENPASGDESEQVMSDIVEESPASGDEHDQDIHIIT